MPACKHCYRLFVCVVSRRLLLLTMINYFCIYICHSAKILSTQLILWLESLLLGRNVLLVSPVHINLLVWGVVLGV